MKLNVINEPSVVRGKLNLACSLNAPVDIRVFRGRRAYTYKSRLYEIREEAGERCVAMDIPTQDGHLITLPRGCEMEVHFAAKSERLLFEAKLLGKSTFRLADGRKVRVLLISYPEVLENSQRRAYFRVSPPSSEPIRARMITFKHKEEGKWTYEERLEAVRAHVLDISAGGIAVRVPRDKSRDIDIETRLKLAFKLTQEDDEIKLTGMVKNRRDDLIDRSMKILGIQFVDVEESPEGARYVDRILKYVAEIQRRELAASRGAN